MTTLLRKTVFTGAVLSAALLAAGPTYASTVTECLGQISSIESNLGADCSGIDLLGRNTDRTCASLNSKLDGADTKLNEAKLDDAIQKLGDFIMSLEDMLYARKQKVDDGAVTVDSLIIAAEDAIICISEIGQ